MRALRGWKLPVLLFVLLLLGIGLYAAWQVWKVNAELATAARDARSLQEAVTRGDDGRAEAALQSLQAQSSLAASRTDGPLWSLLTKAPFLGDDLDGVRTVSEVVNDLAQDGLGPLVQTAEGIDELSPRDGQISLAAVESLRDPVRSGSESFSKAAERLAAHDPSQFVGRLRDQYRDIVDQVDQAAGLLANADTAFEVMPEMLGAEGPRNYLLVFQNNAEIRAGGGLPGAVSLVTTNNGAITMGRQVAANSFGRTSEPVLPLTDAEDEIWNRQLGTFFLDANFTPDFPRTAALWQARWEQEYEPIDGVMTLDPVTLSYLLKATGPLDVPGGPRLNQANVVDELLHQVYLRYSDPDDQDEYFTAVASAVFDRVAGGSGDPRELVEALVRGTREGRIRLSLFDEEQQRSIEGTRIAGELANDPTSDSPQVGVYLNDATGAKMSYFLRHDVQVTANSCVEDVQRMSGRAFLLSDAPADAASLPRYITGGGTYGVQPGSQVVAMQIIGPVGGTITDVQFNGAETVTAPVVDLDGRPVITVLIELEPAFTADVEWKMTSGEGQDGAITMETTPGIEQEVKDRTIAPAC